MIDFLIKNSLCLSFERAGEKVSQPRPRRQPLSWRHFGGIRENMDIHIATISRMLLKNEIILDINVNILPAAVSILSVLLSRVNRRLFAGL